MVFVFLRASAAKAIALPFQFSCDVHVCVADFVCLKHENGFKINMHAMVSNGPKCNH